jgi:heme O synthase-like polyprenyltransferase
MSKRVTRAAAATGRRKSRRKSLLWIAAAVAVVIVLLTQEQVALLYVLATLSVTALLIVVALADLRGAKQETAQAAPYDDSAAISDGTAGTPAAAATTFGSTTPRALKNRKQT